MADAKRQFSDPLVRQRRFPDPAQIFSFAPVDLKSALEDGIVVVDTNVLLVPYSTGKASLEQVRRTYEKLTASGRLRIPSQVAREFADNRAEKLKALFQQLSKRRDVNVTRSEYPLLEGLPEYCDITRREAALVKCLKAYRNSVGKLLDVVTRWHWDDPVSQIYRKLFTAPIIVEPEFEREQLLKELKDRQEHRIPPGYEDASNEYSGVGDLLIWKTILRIGEQEKRDLVFVSGDEKADWRYRSENVALYPRFELVDAYRAASDGKSLVIISFAELLQEFGAPAPVVAEVHKEEVRASGSQAMCKLIPVTEAHCDFRAHAGETVTLEVVEVPGGGLIDFAKGTKYAGQDIPGTPSRTITFKIVAGSNNLEIVYLFSQPDTGHGELREVCDTNQFLAYARAANKAVAYTICA